MWLQSHCESENNLRSIIGHFYICGFTYADFAVHTCRSSGKNDLLRHSVTGSTLGPVMEQPSCGL